jgi:hypothetical protein
MTKPIKAYWFSGNGRNTHNSRPEHFEVGMTYNVADPKRISLCNYGYHASILPLDAFSYVNGTHVDRVILDGVILERYSKCVASQRTHVERREVGVMVDEFYLWLAQEAVAQWPDAPDYVRQGVKTTKGLNHLGTIHDRWHNGECAASLALSYCVLSRCLPEAANELITATGNEYRRMTPWWRRIIRFTSVGYVEYWAQKRIHAEFKARIDALFNDKEPTPGINDKEPTPGINDKEPTP